MRYKADSLPFTCYEALSSCAVNGTLNSLQISFSQKERTRPPRQHITGYIVNCVQIAIFTVAPKTMLRFFVNGLKMHKF